MPLLDMDLNRLVVGSTWRHPQKVYLQVGLAKLVGLKQLVNRNDISLGRNFSFPIM